ncbi:hypothetical protein O6H91_01G171200 [Diphasiastrum complanatum]|uniref:Uncharacterized protein n=1 Tax=Diphasiastrum complanatum TaxID=34168 RepID=A0ACC2EZ02_DIPCM|nr:hypothetical protein O6H91_01G171200 [Diphasiastrum complanatum]
MIPTSRLADPMPSLQTAMSPGRVIVVTGVTRGLGKALALELASRGHVIVGCGRDKDRLAALGSQLEGSNHFLQVVDVASDKSIEEFAKLVIETKGTPEILVNNAGIINKNAKLWEIPSHEFEAVIDINLKGTANLIRHFVPQMIAKKRGIIVNISSGWGRSAAADVSAYCASKWAVEGMTRSLARELPNGLAAVALNPGVINTDMLASCFGVTAALYQTPESWAPNAANLILGLSTEHNGSSLTV